MNLTEFTPSMPSPYDGPGANFDTTPTACVTVGSGKSPFFSMSQVFPDQAMSVSLLRKRFFDSGGLRLRTAGAGEP